MSYAEAYPEQYRKFKASEQQTVAGTPLSEAPFLTEGKRRELRALNIHSIEALAALDGQNLKTLGMGGRELKNQAVAYLEKAQGSADVTGMAAQIAKMQENIDLLMAENAPGAAEGYRRARRRRARAESRGRCRRRRQDREVTRGLLRSGAARFHQGGDGQGAAGEYRPLQADRARDLPRAAQDDEVDARPSSLLLNPPD